MLKEKRQDINENGKKKLRSQNNRLIKGKRGNDKDEHEGGPTFMITTSADVWEVCMVKGDRAREAVTNRAKKKRNRNDEGDSGG